MEKIITQLYSLRDEKYAAFQANLTPSLTADKFIGVRTPLLRKYAKEMAGAPERDEFLSELPHTYFDENQLHAFIISLDKDYKNCMKEVEDFLPYIDNWATCDQLSPKVFKKHRPELKKKILEWIKSEHTYTVRFAIGMIMEHFLDEDFDISLAELAASVRSEEYYINMMTAWYFATALAKQYEAILPFIIEKRLDKWTHNKTIQKAIESYRITDEQKDYLRGLKIK